MFTLIRNYKTLFMMCVANFAQLESGATPVDSEEPVTPTNPEAEQVAVEAVEVADTVKGVTQEQLRDLQAVNAYLTDGVTIKKHAPRAVTIDVQEIFVHLGVDISYGSERYPNGVDGDFGGTMVKAVKAFQTENDLEVTGEVDATTYNKLLEAANLAGGVSAAEATTGEETVATSRVDAATARLAAAEDADMRTEVHAANTQRELETAQEKFNTETQEVAEAQEAVDLKAGELRLASEALGGSTTALTEANRLLNESKALLVAAEASAARENAETLEALQAVEPAMDALAAEEAAVRQAQEALVLAQTALETQEASLSEAMADKTREAEESAAALADKVEAQSIYDALSYTGDIDDIPTREDAQSEFDRLNTLARSAQTAAQEAQAAWDNATMPNWYNGLWDIADTARSSAETAQAAADTAKTMLEVAIARQNLDLAIGSSTREDAESQAALTAIRENLARIAAANTNIATINSQIETGNTSVTALQDALATAEQRVLDESAQARPVNEEVHRLIDVISGLEEKITELTAQTDGLGNTSIPELEAQLAELTATLVREQGELSAAEATLISTGERLSGLTGDVTAADRELVEAQEELTAATEEREYNEYYSPEHALAALEGVKRERGRGAIKAIQQALIDAGADLGPTGADGAPGALTRAAVEAHPDVTLKTLAAYIDTTDNETVETRVVSERPSAGDAIDAALDNLFSDDLEDLDAALTQIAQEFTGKEIDANTRNVNAQYIALKLQSLGQENSPMAQSLMEKIMAEGKGHYENESNELNIRQALIDGSGRFARHLGSFPENFTGSYYKIRQTLQSRSSRTRVENGMEQGAKGNASEVMQAIFGVDTDFIAHRMHMVTGQGVDGDADMSLELGGGILLENAYYDKASGAIYATVAKGNGCEGNLVVIPVETFTPPAPRPQPVPRQSSPEEPVVPNETTTVEEPTQETYTRRVCKNDGYIHILTFLRVKGWGSLNDTLISDERTSESCDPGGGDGGGGDGNGNAGSSPGDSDGGPGDSSGGDAGSGDD